MNNTGGAAVKQVFVKVFGFSDAERHALNTVFRLSASRPTCYALWGTSAPHAAELVLIDGDSWEAALELANPAHDRLTLIWVGDGAPARASLVLQRPLQWAAILDGMEGLRAAAAMGVNANALQHAESDAVTVLVTDADAEARLYLRAKLASAGLMRVDEASSGAEMLQMLAVQRYKLLILDLDLPDVDSWQLVRLVSKLRPRVECLLLTGNRVSWLDGVRGWFAGARACLRKPLQPGKLKQLLRHAR